VSDVKRFSVCTEMGSYAYAKEDANGHWVRYADLATLTQERDAALAEVKRLERLVDEISTGNCSECGMILYACDCKLLAPGELVDIHEDCLEDAQKKNDRINNAIERYEQGERNDNLQGMLGTNSSL